MSAVQCTVPQEDTGGLIADVIVLCTRGPFWSVLRNWAFFLPWTMWAAHAGHLADPDKRLYFSFVANAMIIGWIVALSLRDVMLQTPPPHPQCDNGSYSSPSLEAVMISLYYGVVVVHHLYLRIPFLNAMNVLQFLLRMAFEWFVLVYTGQYTNGEFVGGIGVGLLLTVAVSYVMFVVLVPRFPFFANRGLILLTGTPTIPTRAFERDAWRLL